MDTQIDSLCSVTWPHARNLHTATGAGVSKYGVFGMLYLALCSNLLNQSINNAIKVNKIQNYILDPPEQDTRSWDWLHCTRNFVTAWCVHRVKLPTINIDMTESTKNIDCKTQNGNSQNESVFKEFTRPKNLFG